MLAGNIDEKQNKTLFEWDSISTDPSELKKKKKAYEKTLIKTIGLGEIDLRWRRERYASCHFVS